MRTTQYQGCATVWRILCEQESDPSAERVTKVMRMANAKIVEDRHDIARPQSRIVCGGIVRFVARSGSPGVYQDQLVFVFEGIDVTEIPPISPASGAAVVQEERRPGTFGFVVNTDDAVMCIWH
jgi:hypothetical protein